MAGFWGAKPNQAMSNITKSNFPAIASAVEAIGIIDGRLKALHALAGKLADGSKDVKIKIDVPVDPKDPVLTADGSLWNKGEPYSSPLASWLYGIRGTISPKTDEGHVEEVQDHVALEIVGVIVESLLAQRKIHTDLLNKYGIR